MEGSGPLSISSLLIVDELLQKCFAQISDGNDSARFPDQVCSNSINELLGELKKLEVNFTDLHGLLLLDEEHRITSEISELERELARKNQLIAKATDKLKQWDNIFTENDDSDESELDEEFDDEMKD